MKTRSLLLFCVVTSWLGSAVAAPSAGSPSIGLLFDRSDLPRIRSNLESEYLAGWWKNQREVDRAAESAWLDSLAAGPDCAGLVRVGDILQRESFIYAVTGSLESAAHAEKALRKLIAYPRWDNFHDADGRTLGVDFGPHAAMSAAYALDWLGDRLGETEKAALIAALAEKGCEASYHTLNDLRYPAGKTDWRAEYFDLDLSRWPYILDKTNIKGLMIGGLGIGALALMDKDPRAPRWLDMAEYSGRRFLEFYRADGFYPEGSGYWEKSSRSVFPFIRALARKTGTDLAAEANLRGSAAAWLDMQMPVSDRSHMNVVNFGDNGREITSSPALWVASTYRDGLAQWAALHFSRRHDLHSPIFMDQSVTPERPDAARNYVLLGDREWLIARTGFEPQDLLLAMRSGGPINHEHADRNSVILKAYGEVLLNDIPHPSYSRHDPTWMLRGSAGHNCVLIDGRGLIYHSGIEGTNESQDSASVLQEGRRNGYFFWTSDATPAYTRADPDIKSVVRTVIASLETPAVIVLDKVCKSRYPSVISVLWQVDNQDGQGRIEADGVSFSITRPGAALAALSNGSGPVSAAARFHAVSGREREFPYIEVAPGRAALEQLIITVLVPFPADGAKPGIEISAVSPGAWDVRVENVGRKFVVKVKDAGRLPQFEVLSAPSAGE